MKLNLTIILISLFLLLSTQARAIDPKIPELTKENLPQLTEPDIRIQTLSNGIRLYYLQDRELPVMKMTAYFETGTVYETKEQRGITDFFMSAWRQGGTIQRKPEEIDEALEFVAASISPTTGPELSSLGLVCLQKNIKEVFDIYFGLIREPAFHTDRVELIRKKILNAIKQRNEENLDIANREFDQSLYGHGSPYAWLSTPDTINAIGQQDLKDFYAARIASNRTLVAASSPLPFRQFLKIFQSHVSGWQKNLPEPQLPEAVKKQWEKSTQFVQKPGSQSSIVVGHFGEKRFNPDKYKLILTDEILGGATFGSRLGDRIRTELGLAYGIRSSFGFQTDYGAFRIVTQTKSASTVQTLNEIKKILSDMVWNGNISAEELKKARERILNTLVFEYDIPFNMVTSRLTYDYYGYPPNYLSYYRRQIEVVTLEEVKEVLAGYFFPDRLKVMLVGDRTQIPDLETLTDLGEIPLDEE